MFNPYLTKIINVMFTDELMEQKYNETNNINDVIIVLLENVLDAANKDKANSNAVVLTAKLQMCNNIWKLFASRHKKINLNGFKNFLLNNFPGEEAYINSILDGHIYGKI